MTDAGPPSPTPPDASEITLVLRAAMRGEREASERLLPLVYDELKALARARLAHVPPGNTLQPTALVHEAYMRLLGNQGGSWQNRSHFFGIATQAMRRILVDHARRRHAGKRAGGERITLDDALAAAPEPSVDLVALDEALTKLDALDPRQARVVELRFFGGLDVEQTAETLGISVSTVKRDWTFARAFLQRELDDRDG
jgi:RNA polymerase sigma factor (TIGR02999 family)